MRVFLSSLIMLLGACLTTVIAQDRTLNVYNPAEPVVSAGGSITLLPGFHVPAGSSFHAYISGYNTTPLAPTLSQNQNFSGVTYDIKSK
ncbi:3-coathanger stack domain-containing protein [Arcticibacter sp.]|uniref:3-coathanger stack domain-containing protein n=1 Tax=Arcticibacter sp. TaxID=1872630 RepID=UPI00388E5DF2